MATRQQTLVQLTDELVRVLDQRAASAGRSRSDLIREALQHYLAADLRSSLDAELVEGYTCHPETDDELHGADRTLRESIAEEPW